MLQSMAEAKANLQNLTEGFRDLKRSVEELVDRIDADIDTLRTKSESVGILQVVQAEHARRIGVVEDRSNSINLKIAFASGGLAVLMVILKLVWK